MKQEKIAAMERTVAADYANIAGMVVLKDGERVYDDTINRLTVIAGESFEEYASGSACSLK